MATAYKNKKYQKLELQELKDKVNYWFRYFDENIKRFKKFQRFMTKTTLTDDAIKLLNDMGKPPIEVNSLIQMVAKERAQFLMNEPGFEIYMDDGFSFQEVPQTIMDQMEFLEGNIRHELSNKNNDMLQYRTMSDQLIGGWSAWEIVEEYTSKRSMEKRLRLKKTYHPILTGFDPTAILSHKGDGEYCFEVIPMRQCDYERKWGEYQKNASFAPRVLGDISWSYKDMSEPMVMVCYFYHKEKKKVKLYQLENGRLMTKKEYARMEEWWDENDITEVIPKMINPNKPAKEEEIDIIWRYVFSECGILEFDKTNLKYFPYIFVDGDSQIIPNESNQFEQFTMPYAYKAEGIQQLKNNAYQTLAYEINSWVQSPLALPYECIEDLPVLYKNAWLEPNTASLLTFNAFHKGDKDKPLSGPIPLQKGQTPAILMQFIGQVDVIQQSVMGSSEAAVNNEGPHMSGIAISKALANASAGARPYIASNTAARERVAEFYLAWMERNMINERIVPIIDREGKNDMRGINLNRESLKYMQIDEKKKQHLLETNIDLDFMADMFKIKVVPGNSVEAQKDLALQALAENSRAFPALAGLVNEYGLEVILNNIDIKDIDVLKAKAPQYMEEIRAQKEAAAQNKPQDPAQIMLMQKKMEIDSREKMRMVDAQFEAAELELSKQAQQIKSMQVMADIQQNQAELELKAQQSQAGSLLSAAELSVKKQDEDIKAITAIAKINQSEAELAIKQEEIAAENARTAVLDANDVHKINHTIRVDHHRIRMEEGKDAREREAHEKKMKDSEAPVSIEVSSE